MGRNKINNPIGVENYAVIIEPIKLKMIHMVLYSIREVDLKQPATSLKVLVAASVQPEADLEYFTDYSVLIQRSFSNI